MPDDFDDDDSHPIPKLDVIDCLRTVVGGGAGYGLVIATPLAADPRSLSRLKRKIEVYVEDFHSKEATDNPGAPKPGAMWMFVNIHKDSSAEAFEVIKLHERWIVDNGINLIVNAIGDDGEVIREISRARYLNS